MRIRDFYFLVKPGIVYGNALTAAAGFFIGSVDGVDFVKLTIMLFGISSVIASGCAFNNYIDRDIDSHMERTKNRALVQGRISSFSAIVYASVLGFFGAIALYMSNPLSLGIGIFGLFIYVVVYSMWCKRYTMHATVIGAVAGAVPPVVGYTAATNVFDAGAFILFLLLFSWQMPHALAIALRRLDDYKAAGIPVTPVVMGPTVAKLQMLVYAVIFCAACISLFIAGYTSHIFASGMGILSLVWVGLCVRSMYAGDEKKAAKIVFIYSQILLLAFCLFAAFDAFVLF